MKKIVCFGDSNTYGYNAKTIDRFTEEERWTCLLAKHLGGDYHVVEEGLEGRTACLEDPLFEGLCGFQYLYPCLMFFLYAGECEQGNGETGAESHRF